MGLALPLLVVLGILVPLLGWTGLRHRQGLSDDEDPVPSVGAIAAQLAILQTIVLGLAVLALYGTGLDLSWRSSVSPVSLLLSVAVLAVFVGLAVLEANRPLGPKDRLRAELRKTSATDPAWIGVTLYAGVIEEFAYRGVLTLVLASLIGYRAAVVASALAFGLGHLSGGWRAAALGVPFALAMQAIVHFSGGLLLAMCVHAVYDLMAAWLGQRMAQRGADAGAARR